MSKRKNKRLPAFCSVSWCVLDVCLLEPKAPDCAKAAILAWLPSSPGAPVALAGRSSYKDVAVASVSGFLLMFSWWPLMTLCSSSSIIQLCPGFSSSSSGEGGAASCISEQPRTGLRGSKMQLMFTNMLCPQGQDQQHCHQLSPQHPQPRLL